MDFELDDEQQALQAAAADLLAGCSSSASVRAVVDAGGGCDSKLWAAMVEQGWTGIAVPPEQGGLGLSWVEAAVLLEQVGRHVAPAPILQQLVALDLLLAAGASSAPLADALQPTIDRLVAGDAIACVPWRAVDARSAGDPSSADAWVVDGSTEPAVYAPAADLAVVRSNDSVFLIVFDDAGIRAEREPAMDRTREVGWLRFASTTAVRLGGDDLVERFLDTGAVAYSAELLGVGARSLELAVEYAKEREQFGRPIGSFQAVKHRCADMLVDVEGMRSAVYYAAWCLAASDPDRSVAASTAKTWCSDAGRRVTGSLLQVHGGIGFTWESDVHLFLKRAQLDQVAFGDAVFHRERLARLLRARLDAGESVL